jgi:copper(I)-binding protein
VAAAVELHETVTSDAGLTSMRQLPVLPLQAGETVSIVSGASHVMLVELAAPLVDGTTFDLTLDFEFAPDEIVTVTVDATR